MSLNMVYQTLGLTKQSFHQYRKRSMSQKSEQYQILTLVYQIRYDHPTMGIRDIYYKLQSNISMGRDNFEILCRYHGLAVQSTRNHRRTTDSSGVIRFENLLINKKLSRPNEVWVSDITYFEVKNKFYFLTFILDAFTRRIIGHSVSKGLTTEETTFKALKKAIALRRKECQSINQLIFHSDGGGQYYAKMFLELTKQYEIKNSMCEFAWDNGKAERLNGVIKNNYLKHKTIRSYMELIKEVDRTVYLYNYEKPHIKLQRKTPIEFEKFYIGQREKKSMVKSQRLNKQTRQSARRNSLAGCLEKEVLGSNIAFE